MPARLAASSALTLKLAGSGLVLQLSTIDLSFSSLRSVCQRLGLADVVDLGDVRDRRSFVFAAAISALVASW